MIKNRSSYAISLEYKNVYEMSVSHVIDLKNVITKWMNPIIIALALLYLL